MHPTTWTTQFIACIVNWLNPLYYLVLLQQTIEYGSYVEVDDTLEDQHNDYWPRLADGFIHHKHVTLSPSEYEHFIDRMTECQAQNTQAAGWISYLFTNLTDYIINETEFGDNDLTYEDIVYEMEFESQGVGSSKMKKAATPQPPSDKKKHKHKHHHSSESSSDSDETSDQTSTDTKEDKDKKEKEKGFFKRAFDKLSNKFSSMIDTVTDKTKEAASDIAQKSIMKTIRSIASSIWSSIVSLFTGVMQYLRAHGVRMFIALLALSLIYGLAYIIVGRNALDNTFCRALFAPLNKLLGNERAFSEAIEAQGMEPVPALLATIAAPIAVSSSTTYHSTPVSMMRDYCTAISAISSGSATLLAALKVLPAGLASFFEKWFDPEHKITKGETDALEYAIQQLYSVINSPAMLASPGFAKYIKEVYPKLDAMVKYSTLSAQALMQWREVASIYTQIVLRDTAGTFRFEPYYVHVAASPGAGKSLFTPHILKKAMKEATGKDPSFKALGLDLLGYAGEDIIMIDEFATTTVSAKDMANLLTIVSCLPKNVSNNPSLANIGSGLKGISVIPTIVCTSGNFVNVSMPTDEIDRAWKRRMNCQIQFHTDKAVNLTGCETIEDIQNAFGEQVEIEVWFQRGSVTHKPETVTDLVTLLAADLHNKMERHKVMKKTFGYDDVEDVARDTLNKLTSTLDSTIKTLDAAIQRLPIEQNDEVEPNVYVPDRTDTKREDIEDFLVEHELAAYAGNFDIGFYRVRTNWKWKEVYDSGTDPNTIIDFEDSRGKTLLRTVFDPKAIDTLGGILDSDPDAYKWSFLIKYVYAIYPEWARKKGYTRKPPIFYPHLRVVAGYCFPCLEDAAKCSSDPAKASALLKVQETDEDKVMPILYEPEEIDVSLDSSSREAARLSQAANLTNDTSKKSKEEQEEDLDAINKAIHDRWVEEGALGSAPPKFKSMSKYYDSLLVKPVKAWPGEAIIDERLPFDGIACVWAITDVNPDRVVGSGVATYKYPYAGVRLYFIGDETSYEANRCFDSAMALMGSKYLPRMRNIGKLDEKTRHALIHVFAARLIAEGQTVEEPKSRYDDEDSFKKLCEDIGKLDLVFDDNDRSYWLSIIDNHNKARQEYMIHPAEMEYIHIEHRTIESKSGFYWSNVNLPSTLHAFGKEHIDFIDLTTAIHTAQLIQKSSSIPRYVKVADSGEMINEDYLIFQSKRILSHGKLTAGATRTQNLSTFKASIFANKAPETKKFLEDNEIKVASDLDIGHLKEYVSDYPVLALQLMFLQAPHFEFEYTDAPVFGSYALAAIESMAAGRWDHLFKVATYWRRTGVFSILKAVSPTLYSRAKTQLEDTKGVTDGLVTQYLNDMGTRQNFHLTNDVFDFKYAEKPTQSREDIYKDVKAVNSEDKEKSSFLNLFLKWSSADGRKNKQPCYVYNARVPFVADDKVMWKTAPMTISGFIVLKTVPRWVTSSGTYLFQNAFLEPGAESQTPQQMADITRVFNDAAYVFGADTIKAPLHNFYLILMNHLLPGTGDSFDLRSYYACLEDKSSPLRKVVSEPLSCATALRLNYYSAASRTQASSVTSKSVLKKFINKGELDNELFMKCQETFALTCIVGKNDEFISAANLSDFVELNTKQRMWQSWASLSKTYKEKKEQDEVKFARTFHQAWHTFTGALGEALAEKFYECRSLESLKRLKDKGNAKYPNALDRAITSKESHTEWYKGLLSILGWMALFAGIFALAIGIGSYFSVTPEGKYDDDPDYSPDSEAMDGEINTKTPNVVVPQILEKDQNFVHFTSPAGGFWAIQVFQDVFVMNHHVYEAYSKLGNKQFTLIRSNYYQRTPVANQVVIDPFVLLDLPSLDQCFVCMNLKSQYYSRDITSNFLTAKEYEDFVQSDRCHQQHYKEKWAFVAPDASLHSSYPRSQYCSIHTSNRKVLAYESTTIKGDCGKPTILASGTYAGKIWGFHYGASANNIKGKRVGFSTCVLQEDLKRVKKLLLSYRGTSIPYEEVENQADPLLEVCKLPDFEWRHSFNEKNVYDLAIIPPAARVHIPSDTVFEPINPDDPLPTDARIPAILSVDDPRSDGVDPVKMVIEQINSNPGLDANNSPLLGELDRVADDMVKDLTRYPVLNGEKRPFTIEEAILGRPGHLGPMDLDASAGYELTKAAPGTHKSDWVVNGRLIGIAKADYERRMAMIKQGQPAYDRFEATVVLYLKDELQRPEKALVQHRTRGIFAGDLVGGVVLRQLFGPFLCYYYRNRVENNSAIATSLWSADYQAIYYHLCHEFGADRCVDGDYKGFDTSYIPSVRAKAYEVLYRVASLVSDTPSCAYTTLVNHDCYPTVIAGKFRFRVHCHHFSGSTFTSIINNLVNEIYFRLIFYHHYPNYAFNQCIRCIFYGDDHIVTSKPGVLFDFPMIQKDMAKLGQTYTSSEKDGVSFTYHKFEDTQFCSTKPLKFGSCYMGCLIPSRVENLFNWAKKTDDTQARYNRIYAYKRIMASQPREEYLAFLERLKRTFTSTDLPANTFADTQISDRANCFYTTTFSLLDPYYDGVIDVDVEAQSEAFIEPEKPLMVLSASDTQTTQAIGPVALPALQPYACNAGPADIPNLAANRVKRGKWTVSPSYAATTVVGKVSIPNELITIKTDKSAQTMPLKTTQLCRFNIDFSLVVLANKTVTCKLALVFLPFRTPASVGPTFRLQSVNWLPHMDIYPDDNTLYTFSVPFTSPYSLQRTSDLTSTRYWGTLICVMLTDVIKPIELGTNPLSSYASIDMTYFSGLSHIFVTLPKPMFEAQVLEAVSATAREAAEICTSVATYADLADSLISEFMQGCDEFTVNNKTGAVSLLLPSMPNSSGVCHTTTMDVLPTSRTIQHILLGDQEAMWINKILETPMYLTTIKWVATKAVGETLASFDLNSIVLRTATQVPLNIYLLNMCTYYHCDFVFTFEFVKTKYHSATVRITDSFEPEDIDPADAMFYTTEVINIDTQPKINHPVYFNNNLEYLRTVDGNRLEAYAADQRYTMGHTILTVEQSLKTTSLVSQEIQILVYISFHHFYGVYPRSNSIVQKNAAPEIYFEAQMEDPDPAQLPNPDAAGEPPAPKNAASDTGKSDIPKETLENMPKPLLKANGFSQTQTTAHHNTFKPHNYTVENSGKKFEYSLSSVLAFEKRFSWVPPELITKVRQVQYPRSYTIYTFNPVAMLKFKDIYASYAGSYEIRAYFSKPTNIPMATVIPLPPNDFQNTNKAVEMAIWPGSAINVTDQSKLRTSLEPIKNALELATPISNDMWMIDITAPFLYQSNVAMLHEGTTYSLQEDNPVYIITDTTFDLFFRVGDDFSYHFRAEPPEFVIGKPLGVAKFDGVVGQLTYNQ
ncbi:replicase polyprotein [Posavirus 2]|uniref:Genome polyprotein n=1 Tax=Posavirus 2 TaxID=1105381 RepID=G8E3Y8_9VIRU|nr:replicase polyprotein [Posavirus 2]AER30034.1 replicase polyprotein [Posavirus 2]